MPGGMSAAEMTMVDMRKEMREIKHYLKVIMALVASNFGKTVGQAEEFLSQSLETDRQMEEKARKGKK